jgi:hypothetical protein
MRGFAEKRQHGRADIHPLLMAQGRRICNAPQKTSDRIYSLFTRFRDTGPERNTSSGRNDPFPSGEEHESETFPI